MMRNRVVSSNIAAIGHDEEASTLEIEFRDGGVYQYFGVPAQVYDGLVHASSKGSYFHRQVKDRYSYQRVA